MTINSTVSFVNGNNLTLVSADTKKIIARSIAPFVADDNLTAISRYMDTLPHYGIAVQPWESYKTNNKACFAIAYSEDSLLLKYNVQEQYIKSSVRAINSDVHEDNCVEFFVSFGTTAYYNLEFNCLGSVKLGYGEGRYGRTLLSEALIKKIKIQATIVTDIGTANDYLNWELTLAIPKEVFCFSSIDAFSGLKCKANFYKCGTELPDPHYLTWNMVQSESPDFHRPEFFGDLVFE